MLHNRKIIVILPAYNAEKTLQKTVEEIPFHIVDTVILTDDYSQDKTVEIAKKIGIDYVIEHQKNKGYGANQKTCYKKALELEADIIIMLHPDYQYTPKLIPAMCELITNQTFDVVLGSRILSKGALQGGMPLYKYISNRILTFIQNILLQQKLSEYHTGYRCFNAEVLRKINFEKNSVKNLDSFDQTHFFLVIFLQNIFNNLFQNVVLKTIVQKNSFCTVSSLEFS